jgi:large subunit ribosomal protein L20
MPRAKRGFKARRRRNRVMKHAKGYYGARSRTFGNAIEQVHSAWQDAFAHRRLKKRDFRRLWIVRINAAARSNGLTYSKLMRALKQANIGLDRKILADLALSDPGGFKAVVDAARAS